MDLYHSSLRLITLLGFFLSLSPAEAQDARVLRKINKIEVSDGKLIQTDTLTFLVNNRNGEELCQVTIPYSKMEKVSDINGWIEDVHGKRIRNLQSNDIKDASFINEGSLYQDEYIKTLSLKYNVYPYKTIFTYKKSVKQFLSIADWSPVFNYNMPTDFALLSISSPAQYKYRHIESGVKSHGKDSIQGIIHREWTSEYTKQLPSEKLSVDRSELCPYVKIAPTHFFYGVNGDLSSWSNFGQWAFQLNQNLNDLTTEDKEKVKELTNSITDTKEKIRRTYHFLQDHTRYINISLGIGGFKPYPASYVSVNKYGDCKALSNYMKSLLEVAGIKSYYTIVEGSCFPARVLKEFPSQQFNHIILTVPLGKDTLYLENTSNISPFDYIGTFIQDRDALLISETGGKLIHIPAIPEKTAENHKTTDISMATTGNAIARLTYRFHGYDFDQFNALKHQYNQDQQDEVIKEFMPFSNYEVINWNLQKPDRDSASITLNSDINLYKFLKPLGDEYYFSILPLGTLGFEVPENRELPAYFPFPMTTTDTIYFTPPQGYRIKSHPESTQIQSKFGHCFYQFIPGNNKLTLIRRFKINPGMVTKEDYKSFYSFLMDIAETDRKKIVISTIQ